MFATIHNTPITNTTVLLFWDATFWWPQFPSLHLLNFSKILCDTLVSLCTDISMRKKELSPWSFTTVSGLFAWIVLIVWISKSHKMVEFLFSMTFGVLCSHQLLSCGRPKFLRKHQWMHWSLSWRFRYSVGASKGQPDTRWSTVSVCLSHTLHFYYYYYYYYY